MNITELKNGDILLFSYKKDDPISKAIAYLTDSRVSHAAMYYNQEDETIIEENTPQVTTGKAIDRFKSRTIYVKRLKNKLPTNPVIEAATTYLNNSEPYDESGLYLVGAILVFKKFTPNSSLQKAIIDILKKLISFMDREINDLIHPGKKPMVCSQFVTQCYMDAGDGYSLEIEDGLIQSKDEEISNKQSILDQVISYNKPITESFTIDRNEMTKNTQELTSQLEKVLNSSYEDKETNLTDEFINTVTYFANRITNSDKGLQIMKENQAMFTTPADLDKNCTNIEEVGIITI